MERGEDVNAPARKAALAARWESTGASICPESRAAVIANFANEPITFLTVADPAKPRFTDSALAVGLAGPSRFWLKFGTFFFDYDLDGRLDLFLCNGHLEPEIAKVQAGQQYAQPPQLFWNAGDPHASLNRSRPKPRGTISSSRWLAAVVPTSTSTAMATSISSWWRITACARLLRNDTKLGNKSVRLTLVGDGKRSNTSAIGAEVTIEAGGKTVHRSCRRRARLLEPERTADDHRPGIDRGDRQGHGPLAGEGRGGAASLDQSEGERRLYSSPGEGRGRAREAVMSAAPRSFRQGVSMSEPTPQPGEPPRKNEPRPSRVGLVLLGLLAIAGVSIGVWFLARPKPQPNPEPGAKADLVAAAHANARGIGYLEQFDEKYEDGSNAHSRAIAAFEEAMKLAPDWTPARINLGIALLNTQVEANLDRALRLFAEVIAKEADNAHAHYCTGIIHYYRNQLPEAARAFAEVNRIDPNDAWAWYYRGKCIPDSSETEEGLRCFEKALKLNPYLNAVAIMWLSMRCSSRTRSAESSCSMSSWRSRRPTPRICSTSNTPRWAAMVRPSASRPRRVPTWA